MKVRWGVWSLRQAVILGVISVVLILQNLPVVETARLSVVLPAQPLQWGLTSLLGRLERGWRCFLMSEGAQSEVADLQQRIAALETRLARQEELLREAQVCLQNLNARMPDGVRPIAIARVIATDASSLRDAVLVNAGARDGVSLQTVAVWNGVLVGRVTAVGPTCSRVRLVSDPASRVAARSVRTRDLGILSGRGDGRCVLQYVSYQGDIQAGDTLVSAGTDGVFPPAFLLAQVVAADDRRGGLLRRFEARPSITASRIEHVLLAAWTPPDMTLSVTPQSPVRTSRDEGVAGETRP